MSEKAQNQGKELTEEALTGEEDKLKGNKQQMDIYQQPINKNVNAYGKLDSLGRFTVKMPLVKSSHISGVSSLEMCIPNGSLNMSNTWS